VSFTEMRARGGRYDTRPVVDMVERNEWMDG